MLDAKYSPPLRHVCRRQYGHSDQDEIDRSPEKADFQPRERDLRHPETDARYQSRDEQPHDYEMREDEGEPRGPAPFLSHTFRRDDKRPFLPGPHRRLERGPTQRDAAGRFIYV